MTGSKSVIDCWIRFYVFDCEDCMSRMSIEIREMDYTKYTIDVGSNLIELWQM